MSKANAIVTAALFAAFGTFLGACNGCGKDPVYPPQPNAGGAGGGAPYDYCAFACKHLEDMQCELAKPMDGITCTDLCHQVPEMEASVNCVIASDNCNDAEGCSASPTAVANPSAKSSGGAGGTAGQP